MNIAEAVTSLRPGAIFTIDGRSYDGINWLDKIQTKPTREEVDAEILRLQQSHISTEYQRLRQPEYPSLADFADAYYWMSKGDSNKMNEYVAKCDAVKAKYPKP